MTRYREIRTDDPKLTILVPIGEDPDPPEHPNCKCSNIPQDPISGIIRTIEETIKINLQTFPDESKDPEFISVGPFGTIPANVPGHETIYVPMKTFGAIRVDHPEVFAGLPGVVIKKDPR